MIEENRNSIIIRDVDFESAEYKKFERAFSVFNTVTHKYDQQVYTIIDSDIHIPATVSVSVVKSYFVHDEVYTNYTGTAIGGTISFSMIHSPRDDIQKEALAFLKRVKSDSRSRSRMLNLATGCGKTFVTISTICELKQRAMIIVDTADLAKQWKDQFLFHSDLSEDDIFIISGRESVEQAKAGKYKIFIAIQKTLGMLLDEDLNAMNQLMHKLKIGIRVFDECHVNFHSTCMINSLSNVNFTIYLTATPNRSDFKEDILYSKVFGRVPSYNGHKELNEKYHTVVLASFSSHPTDKQKMSVRTKYGFSMIKWANFVETENCYKHYKATLFSIISLFKLIEKNKKFAIMLPTINLIDKTYSDLLEEYPDLEIGKFIGDIKKENRQDELSKQVILTNNKIFGKGIDVPDLDCIINFVQLSSAVNLEQIIGRLRNNPGHNHVLIDVTDTGYLECRNQLKTRKKFYKKIAKEIKEIKQSLEY